MLGIRGWCLAGLFVVMTVSRVAAVEPLALRGGETVFFAFDDHSIPWQHNLKITLVHAKKHLANPVLRRGPEGAPDHGHAVLYGTVVQDGDKFRMWYLGMIDRDPKKYGDASGWYRPMCYAESTDGVHWTKPDLDGQPLAGAAVSFYGDTAQGNSTTHIPTGLSDTEGNYGVRTTNRPGAPPGWYKVRVVFPEKRSGPPAIDLQKSTAKPLDPRYAKPESTPLRVEVKEGAAPATYDLALKP